MFIVDKSRPDWRLQPFVRAYVQRRTPSTFRFGAVEPFVARLGVMLDFLFASLYDIPIRGTAGFDPCLRAAVIGPQSHSRAELVLRGRIDELVVLFHPQGSSDYLENLRHYWQTEASKRKRYSGRRSCACTNN